MAHVCKWLGYYLCMRDTPKTDSIHPDGAMFDAVIVWKESPKGKEKSGGMAYEVILKPAAADSPVPKKASSPPKERPISQEFIEKKLEEAEERRKSANQAKLAFIQNDEARRQEAAQKIAEQNKSFSEETKQKYEVKLETAEEKRTEQVKALQTRLRDHAQRVNEICKRSEQATEQQRQIIAKNIDQKLTSAQMNRDNMLKSIQDKLKEHEKHVKEVIMTVKEEERNMKEKVLSKMETVLANREEKLKTIVESLKEHEKHIQEVRGKKTCSENKVPVGEKGDS